MCVTGAGFSFAQTSVKVSGTVTSAEDGLPLVGVTVIAGPGVGVSTSIDGEYSIEVAPGTKLVYTSIGYLDTEFVVPGGALKSRMTSLSKRRACVWMMLSSSHTA